MYAGMVVSRGLVLRGILRGTLTFSNYIAREKVAFAFPALLVFSFSFRRLNHALCFLGAPYASLVPCLQSNVLPFLACVNESLLLQELVHHCPMPAHIRSGYKYLFAFLSGRCRPKREMCSRAFAPLGARQRGQSKGWLRTPSIPVVLSRVCTHCLSCLYVRHTLVGSIAAEPHIYYTWDICCNDN